MGASNTVGPLNDSYTVQEQPEWLVSGLVGQWMTA